MTDAALESAIAELSSRPVYDFPSLSTDDAVDLGIMTVELIRRCDLNLGVEIALKGTVVFKALLKGTSGENDPWLRGKAAVAEQFGQPSLLVKLQHLAAGRPFGERDDVDHTVMRAFGGALPLRAGGRMVGTLTVSGEPDDVDDAIAAQALEEYARSRAVEPVSAAT